MIHVEKLGGDTNILVDMGEDLTFTARLFGQHETDVGETLQFDFDPVNCLTFDATGQRI
ncbi:hypothetical protein L0Z64_04715 [Phaeobacter sp. BS23]